MSKDLQSIFKSITPDNIRSIPVIQDAMDVFISTLEEVSSTSIDVKNAFENTNIKEELIKIYLDDLYNVLQQIQFNQKIVEYIERSNNVYGSEYFKKELIYNITNYINDEHFLTIKSYKEKKGTVQAIKYIYDLISTFVLSENTQYPFTLTELGPFNFKVEGSLPTVFYENIIRPLAHPLGFTYLYEQILKLVLEDFYAEPNFVYTTYELEVRCLKTTGETYTFDFLYKPDGTKRTVFSTDTILEKNTRIKRVFFKDGDDKYNNNATYLKQVTSSLGQTTVYYMQGVHLDPGQEYVIKKDYNGNIIYDENGEPARATEDYVIRSFSDQCSIYHRYEFEFRTSLEEDFHRADHKTVHDYWARLDGRVLFSPVIGDSICDSICDDNIVVIGEFDIADINLELQTGSPVIIGCANSMIIGRFNISNIELNRMDFGFNKKFDRDYNILPDGAGSGRREHFYAPSLSADLKTLEGKFELVNVNVGPALQVITQYGDEVKSTVSVARTNPLLTFHRQNDGNAEYTAREHVYEDHWLNLTRCCELIEPVYSGTTAFIDYNGVNRGPAPGPLHTIGGNTPVKLIGIGGESEAGYYIGGYTQGLVEGNPNWNYGNPNNPAIAYFKTCVDGDPVNLQYNTFDVSLINLRASLSDTFHKPEEDIVSIIAETDYEVYELDNVRLYTGNSININGFSILGNKVGLFDSFKDTNLEQTVHYVQMNVPTPYVYNSFTNSGDIGSFDISNSFFVTGELNSDTVLAEVYRAEWNSQDDITLDGVNNFDAITDFSTSSIFVENFVEANETERTYLNVYEYDVYELHEQRNYIGNAIEMGPGVYIHGYLVPITEGTSDTISTDVSETSTYEYNTFEMSGDISGFNIGDEFYVTGRLHTSVVESDIYRACWTEPETGKDAFDNITDFSTSSIFVENFAEAKEVESTHMNIAEYDVFEVHEQRSYIGNAIEVGPDAYVHGYLVPITEEVNDELSSDISETSTYEYNTFEMSGNVNGFNIGDNFFVTGKLSTTTVKSDIYRAYWTELETGEDAFETFECGVYRGGVLLSDNNYSRYVV